MCRYRVNQHLKIVPNLCSDETGYCESSIESEFDVNYVNTVISTTFTLVFSKVSKCLKQNIRKEIDCRRLSCTKQMNRVQIEICKQKYNQVRSVLAVFASTCLY